MPYLGKQPANVPVTADDIPDNSITSAKILDGVITIADIANDAVTEDKLANSINTAIAANTAKTTNSTNASDLSSGTLPMARLSGTLPALDGSALTGVATDTSTIENNIAMLGFYRATDHSKAKYNLVDQVIDDYNDATGVDASASTNETLTSGYYSGTSHVVGNYLGDSSDGALSTSGNVTHTVQNKSGSYDGDMVVKEYSSLTINSGHTMTTDQPCRGMLIYVAGNCTINGTLSMTARGPSANPTASGGSDGNAVNSNGLQLAFVKSGSSTTHTNSAASLNGCGTAARTAFANQDSTSSNGVVYTLIREGAGGGAQSTTTSGSSNGQGYDGNDGYNGSTGQTGGGGGGSAMREVNGIATGGAGSNGSCWGGGSGGGGAANATGHTHVGGSGVAWGGAGGNAAGPGYGTGAGVGNPTGTAVAGAPSASGTGGLIILIVGGTLTIASGATVEAKGVGAANFNVAWQGAAGGASGGGNILLLSTGAYTNNGTISVAGGPSQVLSSDNYTSRPGGQGGNGNAQQGIIGGAASTTAGDLTLQSVASTASSAPGTGDLVTLIENTQGTATVNTDIKGYVSRDNGSNWTQGTLIDEGSWGTNKKILAFHNLDISGQPSGTSLKYKITTHNQTAGSKETNIHATSLAWA